MKIRAMQIRGFGNFCDLQIDPFPDGLVIIEGVNEAGKTTLMSFIRAMLFGFADRRTNQLRYEPVRGGEHGGSMTLEGDDGSLYRIERKPGPSRGEVLIYHEDQVWTGENHVHQLFKGMSEPLFQQIFCFGLDELQRLESLQSEEINGLIYSAGMGTSQRRSYLQIQKDLTEMQSQLYKPAGKNPEINQRLRELEAIEREIRELQKVPEEYNQLQRKVGQLTEEMADLEEVLSHLEEEESWLKRLVQASEPFQQLQRIDAELAELPTFDQLPPDGMHRLERLKEERQEVGEGLARKEREQNAYLQQIQRISLQQELLQAAPQIRELAEERRLFQDWLKKETVLVHQLAQRQDGWERFQAELGSDWNREKVERFAITFERREKTRDFQQQMASLDRQLEELHLEEKQLLRLKEERELEVQEQEARSRVTYSRRQSDSASDGAGGRVVVVGGALALSLVGMALWLGSKGSWLMAGVTSVLGLISGGGAFYLYQFFQKQAVLAKRQRQAEQEQASQELAVREQARDRTISQLQNLRSRQEEVHRKQRLLQHQWESFLVEHQLSLQWTPAEILELFKLLEAGKEQLQRILEEEAEVRGLQAQIDQYLEQGNHLLAQLNRPLVEASELPTVILQIQEELIFQEKQHTKYEELHEKVRGVELDLADLSFKMEAKEAEWSQLLALAEVETEEDFRQCWADYEARLELQKARRQWETALQSIAVGQSSQLAESLQEQDQMALQNRLAQVKEERQQAKADLANFQDQRGRYQARLETMEHSEALSILRQEREELIAQVQELATDWMAMNLCQRLMERAKERYEQERQPGVLRQASKFFRDLTGGRYQRIMSPLGEDTLRVEQADGTWLETEVLSRGTGEQLYLAMRLALAKEYSSRTLRVPLVMDDIFVNFDPPRTRAALKVLSQLGRDEQVIFFTCHPHLVGYLREAGLTCTHLKLDGFRIKEV